MLLRREAPTDVPTIAEIHRRAFGALGIYDGPPVEDRLVDALRADPGWLPALSIVAEDDGGSVVGHVVATEGRLDGVPAVGIGPLGVVPECQLTSTRCRSSADRARSRPAQNQVVTVLSRP